MPRLGACFWLALFLLARHGVRRRLPAFGALSSSSIFEVPLFVVSGSLVSALEIFCGCCCCCCATTLFSCGHTFCVSSAVLALSPGVKFVTPNPHFVSIAVHVSSCLCRGFCIYIEPGVGKATTIVERFFFLRAGARVEQKMKYPERGEGTTWFGLGRCFFFWGGGSG